jgi:hypothetical protein
MAIEVLKDCSDHVTISSLQVLASKEECLDDNFIDLTFLGSASHVPNDRKALASPNKLTTGLPTRVSPSTIQRRQPTVPEF